MELIRKNIHMEQRLDLASTQISLEEDQNISDQKPDVFRIICKKADVRVGETKVQDESVLVRGVLAYRVLYLTDEPEKRLCSIEGEIPFEEKLYTNQTCTNEDVHAVTRAEDMTIRLINSRKINIRCIVAVSLQCNSLYDEEVVVDVEQPQACEILKKPLAVTSVVLDTKDIFRIKDELSVPDGYPNIYSLIWENVRVDGLEFVPLDGRISIQGEWTAFFMYEGEDEDAQPRCFEISRPINGMLEVPECHENMTACVVWEPEQAKMEVRTDYDGEERLIGMDMELKLYIKLYRDEELSVVADAYGLQERLEPIRKESTCRQMIKKENGKIKVSDTWEDKENVDGAIQILHTNGYIVDEKTMVAENEITMTGVVHMEILCKTADESEPYQCIVMDMPYMQAIPVSQMPKDSPYFVNMCIEQLSAAVQRNRIDARAMLGYRVNIYRKTMEPLLVGMEKVTDDEMGNPLPVMSVYFARENESLWDIGKKYRVSLNGIREINGIKADIMNGGEKILIAKAME